MRENGALKAETPKLALPARCNIFERESWTPLNCLRREPVEAVVACRALGRSVQIQIEAPESSSHCHAPPERQKGDIRGFSLSSQRRMRRKLSELRRDADGLFLTLTYHESDPSGEDVKKHLHAITEAMRRRWSGLRWAMCWRLEWQKRGVPHLHLLIWGISFEHKEWFKRTWHRITDETSGEHADVGAWVERMPDGRKLQVYVSKYMAKNADSTPDGWHGRLWGFRNRKHLPEAELTHIFRLTYREAYLLIEQTLAEWGSDTENVPYTLTIWAEDPLQWIKERLNLMKRSPQKSRLHSIS